MTIEIVPHREVFSGGCRDPGPVRHIEFPDGLQVNAGDTVTIEANRVTIERRKEYPPEVVMLVRAVSDMKEAGVDGASKAIRDWDDNRR